jgi:general stress protein 26
MTASHDTPTDQHAVATRGRDAIPEIAEAMREIDTCMLATRAADGELHARPMSNNGKVEWDGSSWFFAPADGPLVSEIRDDPTALTSYRASDRFAWVALSGTAEVVEDPAAKRRNWLPELEQWFPNGPDDPGVVLIRIDARLARWWTEQGEGAADLSA